MERLSITKTYCTPEVHLDRENGVLSFSGRFDPKEGFSFYTPVIEWMKEYARDPHATTRVRIYVERITTTSAKFFLLIFRLLIEMHEKKKEVLLDWFYDDHDEIMDWKNLLKHFNFPVKYHRVKEEIVF